MPLTSAEKMKRRREKFKKEGKYEEYKRRHREAVKKSRLKRIQNIKNMSPAAATKIITTDKGKNRQRVEKWRNKQKHDDATNSVTESNSSLAYNSPSTLGKAAAKVSRALPNSPKKKKAVLLKIVQDHGLQTELSKTNVTPSTSIKSKLSQDTISAVEQFYIRDDISRQAPGMKDCIAIKNAEGIKEKLQIRHLYSSIKETHALFVNENGAIIGKTKFAQLRPKNVLFGNKLPHNVCLCRYHENYIMAVKAMHDSVPLFPQYNHTFAQSVLCENTGELQCWLGKCTVCSEFLKNKIIECVNASHSLPPEVTWHTWKDVDGKLSKIVETGTLDDLTNHIVEMTPQFFEHCYVKRSQSNAYNSDRMVASSDKYDPGGAMVQVDFAENYTCVAQDEIQSFHWMQPQVTLFTVSMWYNRKQHPVVIVSDNRNHNRDTAVVYIDRVLKKLADTIKEVHMWSDGPASQFKNRFIAAALNVLEKRSGKTIVWNYFATSHGKGPVDGIGGALKRDVRNTVIRREAIVFNASQFTVAAAKSNVETIYMTTEEIEETFKEMKLEEIFNCAPMVPGISKCHIMYLQNKQLQTAPVSSDFDKGLKEMTYYQQVYGSDTDSEDDITLAEWKRMKCVNAQ